MEEYLAHNPEVCGSSSGSGIFFFYIASYCIKSLYIFSILHRSILYLCIYTLLKHAIFCVINIYHRWLTKVVLSLWRHLVIGNTVSGSIRVSVSKGRVNDRGSRQWRR